MPLTLFKDGRMEEEIWWRLGIPGVSYMYLCIYVTLDFSLSSDLCHPNLLHSSLQCLNYSSDENRRMSIVNRLATDAGTTTGRIKMAMIIILGCMYKFCN